MFIDSFWKLAKLNTKIFDFQGKIGFIIKNQVIRIIKAVFYVNNYYNILFKEMPLGQVPVLEIDG